MFTTYVLLVSYPSYYIIYYIKFMLLYITVIPVRTVTLLHSTVHAIDVIQLL